MIDDSGPGDWGPPKAHEPTVTDQPKVE